MTIYKSMKEIATALKECAEDTGYSYSYLESILEEGIQDLIDMGDLKAETITKEVDYVIAVSYEEDWDLTPEESRRWKKKRAS